MSIKSLDEVLNDFTPSQVDKPAYTRRSVTIWVPESYKNKFDELQQKSQRRFGRKLRELVLIAIDKTDSKAG